MRLLRIIYSCYTLLWFTIWFLLLLPFFMLPILFPSLFKLTGILNRIWARLLFMSIFMPVRIQYEEKPSPNQQYIICPNHFSYLDIPTIGLLNINAIFVGKSALEKIPLFGWMYKKLHITVDRKSLRSKYNTLLRCMNALDAGKNLVIFPEGGIITDGDPYLARFKDGPFRIAIEKQIPILPVTIYNNWIILNDDLILRHKPVELKVHEAIETKGMTLEDMEGLKSKAYNLLEKELKERFKDEYRRETV